MNNGQYQESLSLNLHLLHYVGLWSFTDETFRASWKAKAYPFFSIFMVSCFLTFFLSGVANIYFILDDLATISQNISVSVTNLLNFIKMIPLLFFRDRLVNIIQTINQDLPSAGAQFDSDKQAAIISKTKVLNKIVIIILYLQLVPTNTLLNLSYFYKSCSEDLPELPSIGNETKCTKSLPYDGWFPFDINIPSNFAAAYIFQIITSMIDTLQAAAMDSFYLSLLVHLSSQFDILNAALRELVPVFVQDKSINALIDDNYHTGALYREQEISKQSIISLINVNGFSIERDDLNNKNVNHKMIQNLKFRIQFHQAILRHATNVCLLLDQLMLAECLVMTFILCLITFHASTVPPSSLQFLSLFGFFACESSSLLLYCWVGSRLIWKSTSIQHAIYETNWYGSPIELRRTIQIFIMRAQKPVMIRASKFSIVSLGLFLELLRLSYSYFTLLSQMHQK